MTFLLFFIVLSLLILIHEWGHFYAARRLGIRVEEFGFGFPPNLISTVKNGTRFVLNLLPIGGYVKIYGEHGEGKSEHYSFSSRPIWQRFLVVAAGVFMNVVLAWALLTFAHGIGIARATGEKSDRTSVTIVAVEPDSPAERAGIRFGDTVKAIRIDGIPVLITDITEFQTLVKENAGKNIELALQRNGTERAIAAIPREHPPEGSGALGIALEYIAIEKSPWYLAPIRGFQSTYTVTAGTVFGFGEIIRRAFVEKKFPSEIAGPVGVFSFASNITDLGISYILQFIAILSVNLAILNALPIPALDGGRIFFMAIEKIRRKTVAPKWENLAHALGFAVLILLMILVTFRDVRNLF